MWMLVTVILYYNEAKALTLGHYHDAMTCEAAAIQKLEALTSNYTAMLEPPTCYFIQAEE